MRVATEIPGPMFSLYVLVGQLGLLYKALVVERPCTIAVDSIRTGAIDITAHLIFPSGFRDVRLTH